MQSSEALAVWRYWKRAGMLHIYYVMVQFLLFPSAGALRAA